MAKEKTLVLLSESGKKDLRQLWDAVGVKPSHPLQQLTITNPQTATQLATLRKQALPYKVEVTQSQQRQSKENHMDNWNGTQRVFAVIFALLFLFGIYTGLDMVDHLFAQSKFDYHRMKDTDKIERAATNLKVAEKLLALDRIEQQRVSLKSKSDTPTASGPVYNCASPESVAAGVWDETIQPVKDGEHIDFCTWKKIHTDQVVSTITGKDFLIQVRKEGTSLWHQCPTSENPDCTLFVRNFVRNRPFKIFTMKDGYVNITLKGT